MATVIVTDSSIDVPAEFFGGERSSIVVVPLHVSGDGDHATTSRPAPMVFVELYRRLAAEGASEIVSIHLSSGLSGTVDSARLAAADPSVPIRVIVVDSLTTAMPLAFAVRGAARLARTGRTAVDVASRAQAIARSSTAAFVVEDLAALHRGGRIGSIALTIGNVLSVKPVLGLSDGRIVLVGKVRTPRKAERSLVDVAVAAKEAVGDLDRLDIGVIHVDALSAANGIALAVADATGRRLEDIPIAELGPVLATHTGKGLLAVVTAERFD